MIQRLKNIRSQLQPLARLYQWAFEEFSLPDFFIIGAQKCGTTSLYSYLCQHPGIMSAERKEIHYFGNPVNRARGLAWYRRHFPTISSMKIVEQNLGYPPITGEASPDMNKPHVPKLVHEFLPNAKLIAIFRNPVERAFSQYHHHRKVAGWEPLSFEEAIAQSPLKLPEEVMHDEWMYHKTDFRGYITKGLYAEQLEAWYQFYSKDSLYILSGDEFFADPAKVLKAILKFLEMPDFKFDCSVAKNIGGYEAKMSKEMRVYLEDIFRPHNRRLYELTGKDFGWPC
jgi:sulfotransferase family protein